jgi:hypothetical protein
LPACLCVGVPRRASGKVHLSHRWQADIEPTHEWFMCCRAV